MSGSREATDHGRDGQGPPSDGAWPAPSAGATPHPDRLVELLPTHIRARDARIGGPLRALLSVIGEQAGLVQQDVEQLYDNWFIETCDPWVVPYLGELVGYQTLRGYTEALGAGALAGGVPAGVASGRGAALAARLAPRRDVAATVADRRRKGTLPLLEEMAATVAEWPARAVEFRRTLARTAPVRLLGPVGAATVPAGYVDVRHGARLDQRDGPFDELAHLASAPRVDAARRQGRYRPPGVGLFIWRLRPYPITRAPAHCIDRARNLFTFSVLGNDTPLVTRPLPEPSPSHIAAAEHVPAYIGRRALADRLADFYGPGKSLTIWRREGGREGARDGDPDAGRLRPVPLAEIVVADLSDWTYRAREGQVVVDPELGRIAFGARSAPRQGVWVDYHYGFADDLGGGQYPREVATAPGAKVYRVGPGQEFERIVAAYQAWRRDNAHGGQPHGIIEITDSGSYEEQLDLVVTPGERLELRAAEGTRPVLRMLDWHSNRPDALQVRGRRRWSAAEALAEDSSEAPAGGDAGPASGGGEQADDPAALYATPATQDDDRERGGGHGHGGDDETEDDRPLPRFVLDGVLVTGRGMTVTGPVGSVVIRHSTLVPGWDLDPHCEPVGPEQPSLLLEDTGACVQIERSVLGTILVASRYGRRGGDDHGDGRQSEPLSIFLSDSVLDATDRAREALSGPDCSLADAVLNVRRSTVFGEIHTHAIGLAENSILDGLVRVARRGIGCVRFCYVPPGSRTPARYHCQPDLVWAALREAARRGDVDPADLPLLREVEAARVRPRYTSVRYGTAGYAQLAADCAVEISRGAEDGAELGAFHDLFQPQREDNLRQRLAEFSPAGADAGIIYVT